MSDEKTLSQVLYIVYQPIPHKNRVAMYVNGDKKKETIKIEVFKKWIHDSDQEYLIPEIMKTLNTYSFYLWDRKNGKAYYLQPNIRENDFKRPLQEEIKTDFRKKKAMEQEEKDPLKRIFNMFTLVDLESAKKILK